MSVAQDLAQTPPMRHNPTPRTDAAVIASGFQAIPHGFQEFARQLEIEITAVREQLAENTLSLNSWIDTASTFLVRAEKAEAECLEQARLLGMSANQNAKLLTEVNKLTTLWQQFISIMNIVEESDSGKEFRPNRIQSCRVLDAQKMSDIIEEAKQLVNAGVNKLH